MATKLVCVAPVSFLAHLAKKWYYIRELGRMFSDYRLRELDASGSLFLLIFPPRGNLQICLFLYVQTRGR